MDANGEWLHTLSQRAGVEMLGSLMTCCLALGSLANALLPRTKGEGMGLLAIALSVGTAIGLPITMFWRVSAFFNPGILLAETVRGRVSAGDFFALLGAEIAGYFAGAIVLYLLYLPHLNAAVQLPAADEVDRLLLDPAVLNNVALMNASYTLGAPSVGPRGLLDPGFWRFAMADLVGELGSAWRARKVADPFRTCPEELSMACDTKGAPGLSRSASEAGLPLHRGGSGGGSGSLKHRGSPAVAAPAGAAEAAEVGHHGQASRDGDDGKPAATYADRLAQDSGPLRSRGHLAAALCKARQDVLLSVFVTRPAVWSPFINLAQEFMAMAIMATGALLLFEQGRFLPPAIAPVWPPIAGVLVGLLNTAAILSLGGPTGPAINPARDLGPRIAFALLPIPGKGCTEWFYGWVPVLGGLAGGAAAGGLVAAITKLLQ